MIRLAFMIVISVLGSIARLNGQVFNAVLVNGVDKTVLSHASVNVHEIQAQFFTDDKGRISFKLHDSIRTVNFSIAAIGCKVNLTHERTRKALDTIYVEILPKELEGYTIKGLSAENVVRKAVEMIPVNCGDTAYFCRSSYRQYQKINGKYANLVEALPEIMVRVKRVRGKLVPDYAFAVTNARWTKQVFEPGHPESNSIDVVLAENIVHNLEGSSLLPTRFSKYRFAFDTTNKDGSVYVIKYLINDFSVEKHGVSNLGTSFWGESYERGVITIERATFALVRFQRQTYRYRDYTYFVNGGNNWVLPERRYYCELRDAALDITYRKENAQWYADRILYHYTNEYYRGGWGKLEYVVTCNYEWRNDGISKYTTEQHHDRFFPAMRIYDKVYDSGQWANLSFPFVLADQHNVFEDLSKGGREKLFVEQLPDNK
ncbi:MAG: hypothetical protein JNM41_16195 [Flavipsychrobacter sp.]|nr:hypothetical protein [Flavipsychrobacter sp.]